MQYDAGPGDRSDRPWDSPAKKQRPQARRRGVKLPPWALLTILVAIVILLCVGLVLIIKAIRNGGDEETPVPSATFTAEVAPSATISLLEPTDGEPPTATVILPVSTPPVTALPTEIRPGALVVVTNTGAGGLNLRESATTRSKAVDQVADGTVLTVLEGPQQADSYTWWKVRTPEGTEGWAAADWLVLKTED